MSILAILLVLFVLMSFVRIFIRLFFSLGMIFFVVIGFFAIVLLGLIGG